MAFTQDQLTALEDAYAAGELNVRHGDKSVTYASMGDLWDAIQRLRRALQPAANRITHGYVRFRTRE